MPLACHDVDFAYRRGTPVLAGLSAEFSPGRVTALVGPNGAGKSTLVRLLLGLLAPAAGAVTLDGDEVRRVPARRRAARLAYISQRPAVAFDFDVRRVVAFGAFAGRASDAVLEEALAACEIDGLARRPFGTLSAGQQQRASLARARVQLAGASGEARYLLADEPISAMDPRHAAAALEQLRGFAARGVGVVVVLHDLTAALRVADDALLLREGGVVAAAGPADAVLTPERLEAVYGIGFHRTGGPPALLPAGPAGGG